MFGTFCVIVWLMWKLLLFLLSAALKGNFEILKALISTGKVDINEQNDNKETALFIGIFKISKFLLLIIFFN